GKDMNFELEGSLQALKSSENLDLFGTLKVKKGFYKLYGKNFTFNKGELRFTGGHEINPMVDFSVLYRFRDIEQQLRKLTLNITGRLLQPELEFRLDEKNIEEKDAIAYIVFSKSVNQLSDNQLNKLMSSENITLNLALGQISNILKETLPWSTRLDVVEIAGENNWKSSSVTLGKYITNKLYLSYEQSFVLDKKTNSVNTEKYILEYQLFRNLILKATNQSTNSGFDLIFKESWK
nr:translocation/assembly module TamB domain-containing protein [Bacteroidales bacterium]